MSPKTCFKTFVFAPLLVIGLSGCLENRNQRAVAGAAGGAVVADALGGSPVTGAVVGGAAGYLCDKYTNECRNR